MRTDHLIRALAKDVSPVPHRAVERRVLLGLAAGFIAAAALALCWLGLQPDMTGALASCPFWMKTSYTVVVGCCAVVATFRLARPDAPRSNWMWWLVIPFSLQAGLAAAELAAIPRASWLAMWLGDSWRQCPVRLLTLAIPAFLGMLWAFRYLAPTRLRETGMAAGILSGACAATVYAFHCPETSASFVLTWYSIGMMLAGLAGCLLGPWLLRW